uniref:Uncharacterized protein n=1 Tax=Romanomermis culicivorax TaxID=13658 RepID=A0A915JUZ1_ROMCU
MRSGLAVGLVPHTVVESGTPCWIKILSMAKQQMVNIGVFGGRTSTFGAVRSFGCVVGVNTLTLRKLLGTVPKQKDRPWSDDVQLKIKNL